MSEPLITAIVSTYRAERFIRGCLEDLVAQSLIDRLEILVIDSGSPEGEGAICEEFARAYPQIRYIRTENEPLYAAWNRAIGMARGKFLTSANTDDRHHPEFMQRMVDALDQDPEVGLVYGEQFISHTENETFEDCRKRGAAVRRVPDYAPSELMLRCITGSQPVWRKDLHAVYGLFNTQYRIAADYDLWLRFASRMPFVRVPGQWGVLYMSAHTVSGTGNRMALNFEVLDIQQKFMSQPQWRDLPGMRRRLAAELFGRGYQHVEKEGNSRAGLPFFREAIKLDPTNLRFIKTYAVRCLASLADARSPTP